MILSRNDITWIKQNREVISDILEKLIEDRKNQIVDEEDEDKRKKLIMWVKELRLGQSILKKVNVEKQKDEFTGI